MHGTKYKNDCVLWKFEGEVSVFAKIKTLILHEISDPKKSQMTTVGRCSHSCVSIKARA